MSCPICDETIRDTETLLKRVEDVDLLVRLACDMADHVSCLGLDPASGQYLRAARAWREAPAALSEAQRAALAAQSLEDVPTALACATSAVACAVESAVWAALTREAKVVERAEQVAASARMAWAISRNTRSEKIWQMAHIRRVACSCAELHIPADNRLRTSLLAD